VGYARYFCPARIAAAPSEQPGLRKSRNPKRSEATQRLGPKAGVGNAGRRRTASGKSQSTPPPNIPPHFEIKVTAAGPAAWLAPAQLYQLCQLWPPGRYV
jgi:hypothetical protein